MIRLIRMIRLVVMHATECRIKQCNGHMTQSTTHMCLSKYTVDKSNETVVPAPTTLPELINLQLRSTKVVERGTGGGGRGGGYHA